MAADFIKPWTDYTSAAEDAKVNQLDGTISADYEVILQNVANEAYEAGRLVGVQEGKDSREDEVIELQNAIDTAKETLARVDAELFALQNKDADA